jgi:hypothetical protein
MDDVTAGMLEDKFLSYRQGRSKAFEGGGTRSDSIPTSGHTRSDYALTLLITHHVWVHDVVH